MKSGVKSRVVIRVILIFGKVTQTLVLGANNVCPSKTGILIIQTDFFRKILELLIHKKLRRVGAIDEIEETGDYWKGLFKSTLIEDKRKFINNI